MKRTILTGILALAAIAGTLMAQQAPSAPAGQAAPAAQPAPARPAGPHPKSPEELTALQALMSAQKAQDPDGIIKAGEDVLTKFADTDYKEMVLTLEGMAYEMKGDAVNEQVAWNRVLEVDPTSIPANLKLGGLISKQTKDKDLDRDDQLAKAEKCLNTALDAIKAQQANPQTTPQAQAQLKMSDAEAHEDLGWAALTRATANKDADPKKYDKAIAEMQIAANEDPDQAAYQVRLAAVLQSAGKNAEAVALCDKVLAMPNLNPAIQSAATSVRNAATKAAAPAK
jgi:tetratricopeptide (TPR) repeat protein